MEGVSAGGVNMQQFDVAGTTYYPQGDVLVSVCVCVRACVCVCVRACGSVFVFVIIIIIIIIIIFFHSTLNGKKTDASKHEILKELSVIASLCNDSSLDYNEVVWCGVVWRGVAWCGVAWRGVVWCGVAWCGVVWCGVVWWCSVV